MFEGRSPSLWYFIDELKNQIEFFETIIRRTNLSGRQEYYTYTGFNTTMTPKVAVEPVYKKTPKMKQMSAVIFSLITYINVKKTLNVAVGSMYLNVCFYEGKFLMLQEHITVSQYLNIYPFKLKTIFLVLPCPNKLNNESSFILSNFILFIIYILEHTYIEMFFRNT